MTGMQTMTMYLAYLFVHVCFDSGGAIVYQPQTISSDIFYNCNCWKSIFALHKNYQFKVNIQQSLLSHVYIYMLKYVQSGHQFFFLFFFLQNMLFPHTLIAKSIGKCVQMCSDVRTCASGWRDWCGKDCYCQLPCRYNRSWYKGTLVTVYYQS